MSDTATGDDERAESTPGPSLSRRRVLAAASATAVGGSALAGCVSVGSGRRGDEPVDSEDVGAIREQAWVETDVDTDGDGESDRVFVRVSRPDATAEGEQVPVIATASPYYAEQTHGDTTPEMLFDRRVELTASDERATATDETGAATDGAGAVGEVPHHRPALAGLSAFRRLEQRRVPQGYAVALVSTLGTHESTGCYTAAGPETARAVAAVVDWFNGRATAYDATEGGEQVTADWATGKTGMIGTSANGELANAAATTGVDGLEAIVPNAANNGQYSLFRANGTPVAITPTRDDRMPDLSSWVAATNLNRDDCDAWTERTEQRQAHATGDYNDFWHEREFLPDAEDVEAAVLLSHGTADRIVKPNNGIDWYEMLDRADVPTRLWLHGGGHTSPRGETWESLLDRWWAHWLEAEDTGVMDEDPVTVVHGGRSPESGSAETYSEWPVPDSEPATVEFTPGGQSAGGVAVDGSDATGAESFVDDPSVLASDLAAADQSDHRLRYETPPLAEVVNVSGKPVPSLAVSFDDPTVVSVALVEYTDGRADVVTRGWADPLNRPRYGEYDSPVEYKQSLRESSPVDEGEQVRVEFPLQATDHVFEAGSRVGLVVYASDRQFTLHPPGESTVTLSLAASSVELPVVGRSAALTAAFADEPTGTAESTATAEPTATDAETASRGTPDGETETPSDTATETPTTATGGTAAPTAGDATATDGADGTTSDGGPGFGVAAALAALGGASRLLGRADDEE